MTHADVKSVCILYTDAADIGGIGRSIYIVRWYSELSFTVDAVNSRYCHIILLSGCDKEPSMEYVTEEDDEQSTTCRSDTSTECSVETIKEYSTQNDAIHSKCESESEESEETEETSQTESPSPNHLDLQRITLRRELERSHRQNSEESRRAIAAQTRAEWAHQRALDMRLRMQRTRQARRFDRRRRDQRFAKKCCVLLETLMFFIGMIAFIIGIRGIIRSSATERVVIS